MDYGVSCQHYLIANVLMRYSLIRTIAVLYRVEDAVIRYLTRKPANAPDGPGST